MARDETRRADVTGRIRRADIRDCGDRAVLVECGSTAAVLGLVAALGRLRPAGVVDVVPGARTVLVVVGEPGQLAAARALLAGVDLARTDDWPRAARADGARTDGARTDVVIDVVYDGADLAEVADRLEMTPAAVVEAHTATPWLVGFGGFAPGFAYLVGGDARLRVPRRSEPRTRVPAGSVGLAGEFSGVYPRESPGGWQLIGRTDAVLWDADRPQPALLSPGMRVRFRAVGLPRR